VARKNSQKTLAVGDAKQLVLDEIAKGAKLADATAKAGRTVETYRDWMKKDPTFKAEVQRLRDARAAGYDERPEVPDFPEFCRDYLGEPLFPHQMRAYDILCGREPRDLHPSMTYEAGEQSRLVINYPPNHGKALKLDTPVFTTDGWSTIGALRVGDRVFAPDGTPTAVTFKSEVHHKPCYRVEFQHGESVVACEDHLWSVESARGKYETLSTKELATRGGEFRLPRHLPLTGFDDVDFILDPYLLGCWLGDGHTSDGRFTTADPEIAEAFAAFTPKLVAGSDITYETHGLYRVLSELGIRGAKHIPAGYFQGSSDQRLALLQGLMDTDGTCSMTGQASFCSTNHGLALGVQFLAASLGLCPTIREGRATLNGVDCGPKWTVWFTTTEMPVFRLERKARNQRGRRLRGAKARKIACIVPVDTVPTQCITVAHESHMYLVGYSLTPTHNTTTFSINYVTWLIHRNPGISIALVSKSQGYAKKILNGVKARLTSSAYRDMHLKFAPDGGWRDPDQSWSATMIYVQGKYDGETEKEPTVEAVGMGGAIYGGRFHTIILDDVVDNENAHRFDDQTDWLMTILDSRLPPDGGLLMVLGTRLAPNDLYGNLRKLLNEDDEQFFTYFAQPAVLDYHDGGEWECLWPYQLAHEDHDEAELRCMACYATDCDHDQQVWMKPRWNKKRLAKKRFPLGERRWSLVWQQQQIPDDATFNQRAVEASINRSRQPSVMRTGAMGHRQLGMQGLYVIGGLDPATVGHTAMMVVGLDRISEKRWVLDGFNQANCSPTTLRQTVMRLTDTYNINEWVIERNAFQRFLTQDPQLKSFLQSRGCRLTEHYTTANKVDPDFGVMSLAPLFDSAGTPQANGGGGAWKKDFENSLIELPDDRQSAVISELVKQLVMWEPSGLSQSTKTDLVMALWFTEIAVKRILGTGRQMKTHMDNPFASKARLRDRGVINLAEHREAMRAQREAV
jgi:hypothetical protein